MALLLHIFLTILLVVSFCLCPLLPASAAEEAAPPATVKDGGAQDNPPPSLAEFYPLALKLAERQGRLEKEIQDMIGSLGIEKKLGHNKDRLEVLTKRLKTYKETSKFNYDQLADLKNAAKNESELVTRELLDAINATIARLEDMQREWSHEKELWKKWEKELPAEVPKEAILPSFKEAGKAIDQSLRLLAEGVKPVLEAQRRVGDVQSVLQQLREDVNSLLQTAKNELFRKSDPSMLSPRYFNEFDLEMLTEVRDELLKNPPFHAGFFAANGWIIILQLTGFFLIVAVIYRNRGLLESSPRWNFIWQRSYATALFFSLSAFSPFYGDTLAGWRLVLWSAAGGAAVRLISSFIVERWRKRTLLILAFLFLSLHFFKTFFMPAPLFRLYVAIVAVIGMRQCFRRAAIQAAAKDMPLLIGALRGGGVMFAAIFFAQIGGYSALATHLLESSIQSIFVVILVWMFAHLVKGIIEFAFGETSPLLQIKMIRPHAATMNKHAEIIINIAAIIMSAALALQALRVYADPAEAVAGIFSLGFTVGEQRYSLGLILSVALSLYLAFIVSWALQEFLQQEIYPRSHMEHGARVSFNRLVHYGVIFFGIMTAIGQLGFSLKNMTFLAGAFGIGIGFGLQNIINNFVSGLILLFERPVKVGDVVVVDGEWAVIKKMGLRATIVQTFGRSDIIVPNSEFISTKVVNLTLTDRLARIKVPVGVAYGSDVPLVMKTLSAIVDACEMVSDAPAPQVIFCKFGESSLDFELRAWVDVDKYSPAISDLHQQIEAQFKTLGIEMPFPQRDLHIRSDKNDTQPVGNPTADFSGTRT